MMPEKAKVPCVPQVKKKNMAVDCLRAGVVGL
jgi:hypothetical protein